MARQSKPKPALRTASLSNQALIENLITMHNMVGANANAEIMEHLLRQEGNLDAILDDGERNAIADQYGWDIPTTGDRVAYIEDQIKRSTSEKGRKAWAALFDGDTLTDADAYHKLRNQRLREQIRQTRKKVEDGWRAAEARSVAIARTGGAETVSWEEGEDVPIERIPTFHPVLDRWFGTTVDEIIPKGKRKPVEVESHGIARGFSYAFGAKKGTGKTRLMVRMLRDMCGPRQTREDGVEFGGHTGLYIQSEVPQMARFRSMFLRGVWKPGQVAVEFAQVGLLDEVEYLVRRDEPDFLVIDSKDMIHEFQGPDGRVRDGMLRFNEMLVETGCTAFIISHISKSSGELKGSSMFGHSVDAIILGSPDEHNDARVNLIFDKNRGGEKLKPVRWKHGPKTIELDEGKVMTAPDKPDLTRLSSRTGSHATGSTAASILAAIEGASGRPAVRQAEAEPEAAE